MAKDGCIMIWNSYCYYYYYSIVSAIFIIITAARSKDNSTLVFDGFLPYIRKLKETEKQNKQCQANCFVNVTNATHNFNEHRRLEKCTLVRDTKTCHDTYSFGPEKVVPACTDSDLDFYLYPYMDRYIPEYIYPYKVILDISLTVIKPISAAKLEISCMEGTPNDPKCFSSKKEDSMVHWPCRLFDLTSTGLALNERIVFPTKFDYKCFGVVVSSTFRVNVTLYTLNNTSVVPFCVSHLFLTAPYHQNLNDEDPLSWRPVIFADTTPRSGVWIRMSLPPAKLNITTMHLSVLKQTDSSFTTIFSQRVHTQRMQSDETLLNVSGWLVPNLERGLYMVYLDNMHPGCVRDTNACKQRSVLKFNINEDHMLPGVKGPFKMKDGVILIAVAFAVVATVFFIFVLVTVYWIKCRPHCLMRNVERTFERSPKITILYTDDSLVHRNCVKELASYLQNHAHCRVLFDEWAMRKPGTSPNEWLLKTMNDAQFYIVVFSKGTSLAFEGIQLPPQRHWMELFNTGFSVVVSRIFEQLNNRHILDTKPMSSFIWVQMDYSALGTIRKMEPGNEYEGIVYNLPCCRYILPVDLWRLVCHIHAIEYNITDTAFTDSVNCNAFKNAITNAANYYQTHPDWLETRRRAVSVVPRPVGQLSCRQSDPLLPDPDIAYTRIKQLRDTLIRLDNANHNGIALNPSSSGYAEDLLDSSNVPDSYELIPFINESKSLTDLQFPVMGDPNQLSDSDNEA